jgi:hypothetical protein
MNPNMIDVHAQMDPDQSLARFEADRITGRRVFEDVQSGSFKTADDDPMHPMP